MADEKRKPKRSCHPRQKWLPAAAAILLLVLLAVGLSVRYISFVSQTIYQESTSHLEEVLYKSNSMLKEMVRKNLTYLHLCNGFLKNTSNEDEIQANIEEAQQAAGFVDFYFLSYDGNYTTVTGETGYLGLRHKRDVPEAETGCQKDQKKDGSGSRQPLVPGIAAAFGFVLFVCHSAHLSVM